jgi:hypothetical protein
MKLMSLHGRDPLLLGRRAGAHFGDGVGRGLNGRRRGFLAGRRLGVGSLGVLALDGRGGFGDGFDRVHGVLLACRHRSRGIAIGSKIDE